mgnify:CR=1 FL=1
MNKYLKNIGLKSRLSSKNLFMEKIGEKAKFASLNLSRLNISKKNSVLKQFSQYLKANEQSILNANKKDITNAKSKKIKDSMIARLKLSSKKISQIRSSIDQIVKFKDPTGKTLSSWKRPNGLIIKKVSIPIGVIGIIYESRPNVTSDVSALCFKSGNVVILRGGSEAFHSNKILAKLFRKALKKKKCDENCVQFIQSKGGTVKLRPDQKLFFPRGWTSTEQRLKGTRSIVSELVFASS